MIISNIRICLLSLLLFTKTYVCACLKPKYFLLDQKLNILKTSTLFLNSELNRIVSSLKCMLRTLLVFLDARVQFFYMHVRQRQHGCAPPYWATRGCRASSVSTQEAHSPLLRTFRDQPTRSCHKSIPSHGTKIIHSNEEGCPDTSQNDRDQCSESGIVIHQIASIHRTELDSIASHSPQC